MKFLRTLSTRSLVLLVALVLAAAGGGAAIAVAAGGSGPTPPPKPLAQAIHDALAGPAVDGITARVTFTNRLFPSGSILGSAGSALASGASGRLWLTNDGRGRIELQSDAGDAEITWDSGKLSIYDASANTVYTLSLPAGTTDHSASDSGAPPSLANITQFLTDLGANASISAARPTDIAGRPAYSVTISPKHDGGLLGAAELAWDAQHGVPLRAAIYAQGSSKPVLELVATEISYGAVAASDVHVSPPSGVRTVDLNGPSTADNSGKHSDVTGVAAVQAAVGFPVAAPDTLVGLPRKDVRVAGSADSKGALVVYGQGLGALLVFEHKADAGGSQSSGALSNLPTVSLDGLTGHELATQLGTVITWERGGVAYVLAGSLPASAAESAARMLK